MSLKEAMEQAWRMRGVASPVHKARWRRKFDKEQGELRLEAESLSATLQKITIARSLGQRRPR